MCPLGTLEGALIMQDYERAQTFLPEDPEDPSICRSELRQCMWAIAHRDEKAFNKYMENRIKMLRRQARLSVTTLDSWGLTVIKLARQRGIECNLNVIELPLSLLDDFRIDTSGLVLPAAEKLMLFYRKSTNERTALLPLLSVLFIYYRTFPSYRSSIKSGN